MLGAVELLRLVTDPGDAVVINPPVYPPFAAFVEHADRRLVNAPLGPDGRLDLAVPRPGVRRGHRDAAAAPRTCCATRTTPRARCTPRPSCARWASWPPGTASGWSPTRSTPRSCSAPGSRFVPTTTQIPDAIALHSASKAFNLAGLRAAVAVPGPEAVDDLARLPAVVADGVTHLGALAQQTAYREGGAWLDEVLDGLRHNQRLRRGPARRAPAGRRLVTPGGDVLRRGSTCARSTRSGRSGPGPARPAPRPSRAQPRPDVRRRGDRLRPAQPGRLDGDADGRRGPARARPGGRRNRFVTKTRRPRTHVDPRACRSVRTEPTKRPTPVQRSHGRSTW